MWGVAIFAFNSKTSAQKRDRGRQVWERFVVFVETHVTVVQTWIRLAENAIGVFNLGMSRYCLSKCTWKTIQKPKKWNRPRQKYGFSRPFVNALFLFARMADNVVQKWFLDHSFWHTARAKRFFAPQTPGPPSACPGPGRDQSRNRVPGCRIRAWSLNFHGCPLPLGCKEPYCSSGVAKIGI